MRWCRQSHRVHLRSRGHRQDTYPLGQKGRHIESSLESSATRSDEQLGYYVTQVREVIDYNAMTQKEIFDELWQLNLNENLSGKIPDPGATCGLAPSRKHHVQPTPSRRGRGNGGHYRMSHRIRVSFRAGSLGGEGWSARSSWPGSNA